MRAHATGEQGADPQRDSLLAAGRGPVLEEHASGADRTRPVLARLSGDFGPGDTLMVVRLDRLARPVTVIERLAVRGAHLRSLGDPAPV